ncbi:transcriptional regulator, ArsR family [Acidimicrobium ferrooxidans DSM 10331]|uniref:Transcriptional regulator, ArsR family n=1 Tax=Acidimicrobium ferrooxidans (strain DSM 10331 / JCM 15462 / NBRC 103882 / ICP) TaxID=525909 RepID=C7M1C2_ACIFD|nr:transcriptional regulator, ArsR family [Acidimicrobium ferrooxidans DSM 10331]
MRNAVRPLVRPDAGQSTAADVCTPTLTRPTLDRAAAQRLATLLRAVADPARLQLISLLQGAPLGEACVCDLVAPLGLAQPTVSHHLKVLLDAGIVSRQRRGMWVYYRLVPERLGALAQLLGRSDDDVLSRLPSTSEH